MDNLRLCSKNGVIWCKTRAPGENTTIDLLKRGDNDATLVIGSDPGAHFPKPSMEKMMNNPLIVINPDMNCTSKVGDVLFPTQWCGIECEGTAYRMDHVPILLKKVVESPPGVPSDQETLRKILAEIKLIKAQKAENSGVEKLKRRVNEKADLTPVVGIKTQRRMKQKVRA
jgi:hypothetical protein